MNDNDFNKGIADIRNLRLLREERSRMLRSILHGESRGRVRNFFAFMLHARHKALYALSAVTVLFLTGGGTVVLADEGSVPGDLLYPIKMKVK